MGHCVLLYLIVNVCNLIQMTCVPIKNSYHPLFESSTLHEDYNIIELQHRKANTFHGKRAHLACVKAFESEPTCANKLFRMKQRGNYLIINKHDVNMSNSYDYQALLEEYYMESKYEADAIETYQPVKADLNESSVLYLVRGLVSLNIKPTNCTTTNDIGIRAIMCLIEDFKTNRQPLGLVKRFWKIAKTWFLVYLFVAVPLWCTKGWCCCCLTCKFFKPQQTIDEARRFLLLNPPGIYKKKNRREVHYHPSGREKQCFEEFEHLIKTL